MNKNKLANLKQYSQNEVLSAVGNHTPYISSYFKEGDIIQPFRAKWSEGLKKPRGESKKDLEFLVTAVKEHRIPTHPMNEDSYVQEIRAIPLIHGKYVPAFDSPNWERTFYNKIMRDSVTIGERVTIQQVPVTGKMKKTVRTYYRRLK